ncbi:hypothetical protein [Dietzia lutea]|uniref:SCP2 domain-containing protein n=1 Tax=Dietzia lutea TaxID=546160 RepID=A0A2S1R3V7_9ACTN|nr:hypothetical protein [Dietzia lutea]AWH90932.1 hypothetical protein A6035_00645 [Dietzia lutea]
MTTLSSTAVFEVDVEHDPTPFVLSLGHILRIGRNDQLSLSRLRNLGRENVVAAVTVADTPRKATITFSPGGATVAHGIADEYTTHLVLAPDDLYRIRLSEPEGTDVDELVYDLSAILNPPLKEWPECAEEFWDSVSDDAGLPEQLVVVSSDGQELVLGHGASTYEIHAHPADLQRLFAGMDSFFDLLFAGKLRVRGTLPQLSAMAGASWKVQYHG